VSVNWHIETTIHGTFPYRVMVCIAHPPSRAPPLLRIAPNECIVPLDERRWD
jgi:hypothetical protein